VGADSTAPTLSSFFASGERRSSRGVGRRHGGRGGGIHLRAIIVVSMAITWLPLLVLSIIRGVAWNDAVGVPFLRDFLPYGQFLLAVPALIIAERLVPDRLSRAAAELKRSGVVAEADKARLGRQFDGAARAWGGTVVNGTIVVLVIGITIASLVEARDWLTGSWQVDGNGLTLPGGWYLLVSLPVLRFLELRWIWRLLAWALLLWRTSTLKLEPRPEHPDRAGGLAFLGEAQLAFGWLVLAFGVQLSCLLADRVFFRGADLMASSGYVAAFVVISLLVLLLPLLAFVPEMARARYDGILFLSSRGFAGAGAVSDRLHCSEGPLPDAEVSGLADFGTLLNNARLMRLAPMELRQVLVLALVALAPFLPLVFLVMPAQEVLRTLTQLVL
jgi:hypothetical protein